MNKLQAGFSRVNVTPPLGIPIVGYYKPRFAEGVLDELEVNALALAVEDKKVVLISVDNCGFSANVAKSKQTTTVLQVALQPPSRVSTMRCPTVILLVPNLSTHVSTTMGSPRRVCLIISVLMLTNTRFTPRQSILLPKILP